MLLIANVLELNGGTTFILRVAREFYKRNQRIGVLVLVDKVNAALEQSILQYADIYYLKDFTRRIYRPLINTPLGVFAPVDFSKIATLLNAYNAHVHVMGVFGLIFIKRCLDAVEVDVRISFGIYHQNEVMFDGVPYYFARKAKELFASLPAESVVFFNEKNCSSYGAFFGNDYSTSTIVPIGIDIPTGSGAELLGRADSNRIVSIGNLYAFKSYNRHVISLLPELKKIRPDLVYDIYGTGDYEPELLALVSSLQLESSVKFRGSIGYEDIPKVLNGALAFVGSGTAILEAAALGVPAIIGIESTEQPITYGLLSDINGLSYNELDTAQSTHLIKDVLQRILGSADKWHRAAVACKAKSSLFSIERTVDGLMRLEATGMNLSSFKVMKYSNKWALCSFLICAAKQGFFGDKTFSSRREQGTLK